MISHWTSAVNRIRVAGAVLSLFLLPVFTPDARASEPRWYVGLSVPVMFLDDSETVMNGTSFAVPYSANAVTAYKAGVKVSGMVGREFGNGFRLQVEAFFARANVNKLTYTGITVGPLPELGGRTVPLMDERNIDVSGLADQMGAMVNVWYDFNEGSRWRPFIGGGLGFVQVDWGGVNYEVGDLEKHIASVLQPPNTCQPNCLPPGSVPDISDTDTVFAFKVGGGLGYELTNHLTLQVSYRFFKANKLEFDGRKGVNNFTNTRMAMTGLQGHLFEVGVRYRF